MSIRRFEKFKDDTVKSSLYKTHFGFRSGFDGEKFSYDLPWVIKPSEKYIFFLHGKIVEKQGPNARHPCFGIYDYHGIVKSFENRGFTVISEMRSKGTKLYKYSGNIVRQINTLLVHGIPPEQITVVGFSKGSAITLLVSAKLKNPEVNFVVMSVIRYQVSIFKLYQRTLSDYFEQTGNFSDYFIVDGPTGKIGPSFFLELQVFILI